MAVGLPLYTALLSSRALVDLREIHDHIRVQSPQNADAVRDYLLDQIAALDTLPTRFRRHGRTAHGDQVHAMTVSPHIVYYRVDDSIKTVLVLHIRHGARRQPRRF